jgi:hypothetical protein
MTDNQLPNDALERIVRSVGANLLKPDQRLDESLLREIAKQHLVPLFSGAEIADAAEPSSKAHPRVAFINPQVIAFKVNRADDYRLHLRRAQPFEDKAGPARERRVIEAFVEILAGMGDALQSDLRYDLLSTFQRRIVARAMAEPKRERQLLAVLDQMAEWASRLYEGSPISSAIGIDPNPALIVGPSLSEIAKEDFGAVLSNGFDTMLVFGSDLTFTGHCLLGPTPAVPTICPARHSAVASWTAAGEGRVAVVLNRLGEILVFCAGQLLFARRSGRWHFLTHDPILSQMSVPQDRYIREALYQTALDASFARTGACLGVVATTARKKWEDAVAERDRLETSQYTKARTLAAAIDGRKFHELPRTLRQELVAIDGATIINHKGEILAVGAILTIAGGSTGGGRTAAAKTLAQFGLGMKVSQDGGITGYRPPDKAGQPPVEAFKVM